MGTGEAASGTSARHSWRASTGTGTTLPSTAGSALAFDRKKAVPATGDCVRFDVAAQQLSACACVSRCLGAESCAADLCIGHVDSSWQHAMRASGVAFQPAHTATFPTHNVRIARIADRRRTSVRTTLGCWTDSLVSNQRMFDFGGVAVEPTRREAARVASFTRGKPSSHRTPKRIRSRSLLLLWHRRRERNTHSRCRVRARRNTSWYSACFRPLCQSSLISTSRPPPFR